MTTNEFYKWFVRGVIVAGAVIIFSLLTSPPTKAFSQENVCTTYEDAARVIVETFSSADAHPEMTYEFYDEEVKILREAIAIINGVTPDDLIPFDGIWYISIPGDRDNYVVVVFNEGCVVTAFQEPKNMSDYIIEQALGQEVSLT